MAMAKYDLTPRIAPNLDRHLVFPLLEFTQERELIWLITLWIFTKSLYHTDYVPQVNAFSKSGSTGDRLKETQNHTINRSLSSRSDDIFDIAKKEEHIPYENSKVTYFRYIINKKTRYYNSFFPLKHMLIIFHRQNQPCLGGDSKMLMVVNVSTAPSLVNESVH
ncbi:putative minus-end-directed kinesin ATPase [Helianthus anomalus]